MSAPIIRPATREDMIAFWGDEGRGPTVSAWCMELEGEIVGIAGVVFSQGHVVAFVDAGEKARPYKFQIHRASRRFMKQLRESGVRRVIAHRERSEPASDKWLRLHGFIHIAEDIYQCLDSNS